MSEFRTPFELPEPEARVLLQAWCCPECLTFAAWSMGPRALGTSVNITCLACQARFNVSPFVGKVERI